MEPVPLNSVLADKGRELWEYLSVNTWLSDMDDAKKLYTSLLKKYLGPYAGGVTLLAVLIAGGIALHLAGPQVIRYFIDTAQSGGQQQKLLQAAVLFITVKLSQQAVGLGSMFTAQNVGWKATNLLRRDLTLHCLGLDMDFHQSRTPGELIERIDGDVNQLVVFFSSFVVQVIGHLLLAAGILFMLFREDLRLGLALTVYAVCVLWILSAFQRLAVPHYKAGRQASAEQYAYIEERLSGVEDIRSNGAEDAVLRRLYDLMKQVTRTHRLGWFYGSMAGNGANLLFAAGYAAGLGLGVYLYMRGEATLGTAYLIVTYVGMLSDPLQQIRSQVQDLQQAGASISRINELFNLRPQVVGPSSFEDTVIPRGQPLAVVFDDVSFGYSDNGLVLHNISFTLPAGRVLGILGRTGSGKTSLTRLLFRLYDPNAGKITLNSTSLPDLPLHMLRERIGMVTQDVQLFQASVRDNLTFFDPQISSNRILTALEELGLRNWVESLPHGLDTILAAGGQGLSAGEAQLLAFTRLLLKDPGVVVLDEASSRLDPVTEGLLERASERMFRGRTGLVIAHRLPTVQRADDILILENGRVVEYGPRVVLEADPNSRFAALLKTGLEEALA
jgi:ATP-binding cassette, subfamily B, bacterial